MKKKAKKRELFDVRQLKNHIRNNKAKFTVYVILRLIVISAMIVSVIGGRYENLFACTLALIFFLVPAFVEKNFGIHFPTTLEVVIMLFVFASVILGEIGGYYEKVPMWDTMLHTANGFLCAAIGFSLVDVVNRNDKFKFQLSPLYVAIVAFCFSMTIGVIWEMFEFSADFFLGTDMQKDFVIHRINSAELSRHDSISVVSIENIKEVTVDGIKLDIDGYLDIGLIDTMKDLAVNFIGAIVFSIIGFFYIKNRGKGNFAKKFIPFIDRENGEKNMSEKSDTY